MSFGAQVEVTVLRLEGFGKLRKSVGGCFVLARIGGKLFGRSKLIPDGVDSFELTQEPMLWCHEARVDSGAEVQGSVQVWQDNGDEAPTLAVERTWSASPDDEGEVSIGTEPAIVLEVRPRFAPDRPRVAFIPRIAVGSLGPTFATLVSRPSASVTITSVRGLYRPVDVQSTGMHSASEEGYTSSDHRGRVFINRDVDGTWKKGYQAIELEVKVETLAGRLPPGCRVVWTLHGEDDPINDRLDTHREWGPVLDPGDYDAVGVPTGASGNDSHGLPPADPKWQEIKPHALSFDGEFKGLTASTTIEDGVSRVRLLCTDQGGDVFSVSADLEPLPGLESFGDRTGVMTMWNRFDVEYKRMQGALSLLPWLRPVATSFEPACIQVDFADEVESAVEAMDWDFWETPQAYPVIASEKLFSQHKNPGWIFVVSAAAPSRRQADVLFPDSRIHLEVQLMLPADPEPSSPLGFTVKRGILPDDVDHYVIHHGELRLFYLDGERFLLGAEVEHRTLFHLWLNDYGSAEARGALYPYSQLKRLRADDYGVPVHAPGASSVPPPVRIEVVSGPRGEGDAIATMIGKSPANGGIADAEYWWGVSFVYAVEGSAETNAMVGLVARDIVHEMVHGFGLHHRCGYFDLHTPRRLSCACNYDAHALWTSLERDDGIRIDAPSDLSVSGVRRGERLCGYHVRELRRMRFHLHPGFDWNQ